MNIHQLKQYIQNNLWYGEAGAKPQPVTPGLIASVLAPPTGKVFGIDISHWNLPPVDLRRMKEQFGMSFVIIKGADGSLKTKYFPNHVQAAKDAGLPFGMYVWLYPGNKVSIAAQVGAWVALWNEYRPLLGVFIDAEWTYYGGQPANPTAADLRQAHNRFLSLTGEAATTYTAKGYADVYLSGFDWNREELWIANYGVSSPAMPNGATEWTFWQFTNVLDGLMLDPNGNKSLDGNYFSGTAAEFAAKYGGTVPPPTGGTMKEGVLTPTTTSLRVRSGPATTYPQIGGILQGDKVYGTVDTVSGWLHIEWIIRAGGLREDLDGWCSASPTYITLTDYVPPAPELTVNAVLKADGTVTGTWTEK